MSSRRSLPKDLDSFHPIKQRQKYSDIHYKKMYRDIVRSFKALLGLNRVYNSNDLQKTMRGNLVSQE